MRIGNRTMNRHSDGLKPFYSNGQRYRPTCDHEAMKSYSEDLRKKIVAAVERGMSKPETARLFGVSLSSVERYVGMAGSGESLAPKKRLGRAPKVDQSTKSLLDEDIKERPAATIAERIRFLDSVTGKRLSYSTIRRALKV
jgi:transposase